MSNLTHLEASKHSGATVSLQRLMGTERAMKQDVGLKFAQKDEPNRPVPGSTDGEKKGHEINGFR